MQPAHSSHSFSAAELLVSVFSSIYLFIYLSIYLFLCPSQRWPGAAVPRGRTGSVPLGWVHRAAAPHGQGSHSCLPPACSPGASHMPCRFLL